MAKARDNMEPVLIDQYRFTISNISHRDGFIVCVCNATIAWLVLGGRKLRFGWNNRDEWLCTDRSNWPRQNFRTMTSSPPSWTTTRVWTHFYLSHIDLVIFVRYENLLNIFLTLFDTCILINHDKWAEKLFNYCLK